MRTKLKKMFCKLWTHLNHDFDRADRIDSKIESQKMELRKHLGVKWIF